MQQAQKYHNAYAQYVLHALMLSFLKFEKKNLKIKVQ